MCAWLDVLLPSFFHSTQQPQPAYPKPTIFFIQSCSAFIPVLLFCLNVCARKTKLTCFCTSVFCCGFSILTFLFNFEFPFFFSWCDGLMGYYRIQVLWIFILPLCVMLCHTFFLFALESKSTLIHTINVSFSTCCFSLFRVLVVWRNKW